MAWKRWGDRCHGEGTDNPVSSARTRNLLGWRPQEAELLTDLKASGY
jgi:hypothetical protein